MHKDCFDGSLERFYLPYCLDIYENKKINDIKNKDFKIVIDPLPLKKKTFLSEYQFFFRTKND